MLLWFFPEFWLTLRLVKTTLWWVNNIPLTLRYKEWSDPSHFFPRISNIYYPWTESVFHNNHRAVCSFLAHRDISQTEFEHRQLCYFKINLKLKLMYGEAVPSAQAWRESWFKMQTTMGDNPGAPSECLWLSSFSGHPSSWRLVFDTGMGIPGG